MPIRRNESMNMMRREPQAYVAEYDANDNVEYEAWADPGSLTTESVWICAKNTYNAKSLQTKLEWAQDSNGKAADFTNKANNLSGLDYV